MFTSNCVFCGSKETRFIKEQETKGLVSTIGKISILGPLLILLKITSMNLKITIYNIK